MKSMMLSLNGSRTDTGPRRKCSAGRIHDWIKVWGPIILDIMLQNLLLRHKPLKYLCLLLLTL